jgi:uncharacterized membrane protein
MSHDNVTPFRRPPKRPVAPQQRGGMGFKTHRGKAVLVHILTLACFLAPFVIPGGQVIRFVSLGLGIAAAVIAYTSRHEAMPWAATHHEQALRTLLIAFLITTILGLPSFVVSRDLVAFWDVYGLIYLWGSIIVMIWAGLRALIGLVLAGLRKPVPNPRGWLV